MGKHHPANVVDDKPVVNVPEKAMPMPDHHELVKPDPAKRRGKPKLAPRATRDEPLPKKGPKHYKPRRR